ncbi:hypothetical protein [Flavobacterium sp. ACN6]|nr:hypothetical protein [Flavobacterium sp. ACN6]PBJ05437.1 hypothetical protein BSF42_43040 [Flavobacterium sp. ACN6]
MHHKYALRLVTEIQQKLGVQQHSGEKDNGTVFTDPFDKTERREYIMTT